MSQSLAAAKKRRAPNEPVGRNIPSPIQTGPTSAPTQGGLTLPQVIQVVDRRLIILETFMNETKTNTNTNHIIRTLNTPDEDSQPSGSTTAPSNLAEIVEEFDKRYELLAEEIVNIKNIVLSLQSYTMDVNKMLLEERSQMFSAEPGAEAETPAEG
jgi:hypothetical protein